MKVTDIDKKLWNKLDEDIKKKIMDYIEHAFPEKGPSEKVEQWIKEKLNEVR